MSAPPPLEMRPTWNALTMVEPKANVSGSTSVACWLVALVKVSVLNLVSGISGVVVVDGEIPAHAGSIASSMDKTTSAGKCRLVLGSRESMITAKQYKCAAGC
jgi:hypothetical protein